MEKNGHDSVTRRAVVPTPRKLALLVQAISAWVRVARSDAKAKTITRFDPKRIVATLAE